MLNTFDMDELELFGGFSQSLAEAIKRKNYARAYALLRKRTEPLDRQEASECLAGALSCTVRLFRTVLEACEPGEYAAGLELECGTGKRKKRIAIQGTILTLAAALDKAEHARILLEEYGYDCNSASLASAHAVNGSDLMQGRERYDNVKNCAVRGNVATCSVGEWPDESVIWRIQCCTPLAAAVACGAMFTTKLLLEQQGIWRGESSAVCRAAMIALRGDWRCQDCAIQVFPMQDAAATLFAGKEDVLKNWNLQPAAIADICGVEELRLQMKNGLCTPEDIRALLEVLGILAVQGSRNYAGKLLAVAKYYPDICKEPKQLGVILRAYVSGWLGGAPDKRLLQCWRRLSGPVVDLSWAESPFITLPARSLRALLLELKEGKEELVMDADAVMGRSHRGGSMAQLVRHVRFRWTDGREGITAFAAKLLSSGNLKLAHQAVQQGLLLREPKAELLAYIQQQYCNPALRPLVLAMPGGPGPKKEQWRPDAKKNERSYWSSHWTEKSEEELERWRAELWEKPLSKEECLRRLITMRDDENYAFCTQWGFHRRGGFGEGTVRHPRLGEVQVDSSISAACAGENPALLQAVLELDPEAASWCGEVRISNNWCRRLFATPLCLAAALGRTEQVRLLLESGHPADELGTGQYSILNYKADKEDEPFSWPLEAWRSMAVTPLLAAILMGEEETARLLLDHGARCDFSQSVYWNALAQSGTQAVELASRLPGVGLEKVPEEKLRILRESFQLREGMVPVGAA